MQWFGRQLGEQADVVVLEGKNEAARQLLDRGVIQGVDLVHDPAGGVVDEVEQLAVRRCYAGEQGPQFIGQAAVDEGRFFSIRPCQGGAIGKNLIQHVKSHEVGLDPVHLALGAAVNLGAPGGGGQCFVQIELCRNAVL